MTFGDLRRAVLAKARVGNHFEFRELGAEFAEYWDRINEVEYERGYGSEYLKPGAPALCDMDLLEPEEYRDWLARCPAR